MTVIKRLSCQATRRQSGMVVANDYSLDGKGADGQEFTHKPDKRVPTPVQ
jgi:hypothetical protein